MGHLRDLPKSKLGVDIEGGFAPDYQPIKGKEDVIGDLKKAAKKSGRVYLATDPDREGEAISWHLKELLGIPDDKTYRVTFNEITKKVVNDSIAAPRAIDQDLVNAQQARRILDRIVGYQLSPLLWRKIRRGLSAGRVQSVATRLVVEREEEIRAFQPQEYWSIEAALARVAPNLGSFKAQFYGREKKMELHSAAQAQAVVDAVEQGDFSVSRVKRQEKNRQPAPPFTTSTFPQAEHDPRPHHVHRPAAVRGHRHLRRGRSGSDHLYAYRLPPSVGGGPGRSQGFYPPPVWPGVLPPRHPALQDQGQRPGCPRGHPSLRRDPDPGGHQKGPDRGAVSPV